MGSASVVLGIRVLRVSTRRRFVLVLSGTFYSSFWLLSWLVLSFCTRTNSMRKTSKSLLR